MSDRVIGLDIGSSSVKAAQVLRKGDGSFVVEKQAARPLPRGAVADGRIHEDERLRVSETLKQLAEEAKFSTKDVILGYNSSSSVFMQEMQVPLMRPEDVAKALPEIIQAKNPSLSPDENELSYTVVGEVEGDFGPELKVIVYSVRADYAREVAEVAEAAGFNIVGADLNALATLRAVAVHPRPAKQVDAIVDIGSHVTAMFLHHNGVPKMLHLDPDSAGSVATSRIADALGLDDDQEHQAEWQKVNTEEQFGIVAQARNDYSQNLANKIASGFNAYLGRSTEFNQIANLTLVGGGALIYGLGFYLQKALGSVPLSYAQVAENVVAADGGDVEFGENGSGGDYLVAIGLGTGERL